MTAPCPSARAWLELHTVGEDELAGRAVAEPHTAADPNPVHLRPPTVITYRAAGHLQHGCECLYAQPEHRVSASMGHL